MAEHANDDHHVALSYAEAYNGNEPRPGDRAILDGTRVPAIEQPLLDDEDTRRTAAQRVKAERRKSRKADKEEDSSEDNADQAGIVARRPRTIKSVLEKAKLLPLTATNRDGQRWKQIDGGPTEAARLRLLGHRRKGSSAAFARESAGIIGLYQDIIAPEGPGGAHHYSPLANSLVCLTKQKFENMFSVVSLLVRYVNIAHVYSEFENELQDKKSSEYQKYKAAVEGHKKEFGKLHMGASHRQYILTQAAKSHFTKMEKLLNTALALSYLGDAFGPDIHALLIA
ncbi:MAG: Uncharacterized protein AUREO_038620 [Aureobasidium pullulans]|nr:MAG: Uncharacterized protein AUREO_038620 [Aureobasidium pullulans]